MKVTREEWLAALERLRTTYPGARENEHAQVIEVVLGPCPPDPEQVIDRLATWIERRHPGVDVNRETGLVVT